MLTPGIFRGIAGFRDALFLGDAPNFICNVVLRRTLLKFNVPRNSDQMHIPTVHKTKNASRKFMHTKRLVKSKPYLRN